MSTSCSTPDPEVTDASVGLGSGDDSGYPRANWYICAVILLLLLAGRAGDCAVAIGGLALGDGVAADAGAGVVESMIAIVD